MMGLWPYWVNIQLICQLSVIKKFPDLKKMHDVLGQGSKPDLSILSRPKRGLRRVLFPNLVPKTSQGKGPGNKVDVAPVSTAGIHCNGGGSLTHARNVSDRLKYKYLKKHIFSCNNMFSSCRSVVSISPVHT